MNRRFYTRALVVGGLGVGALVLKTFVFKKKPRKSPLKSRWSSNSNLPKLPSDLQEDYEKDVVYLYQFQRPKNNIPNLSPFCLKLETWLRMAGIKYENVFVPLQKQKSMMSKEGMMPFIELNGKEYSDSGFVIRDLPKLLGEPGTREDSWTAEQRAVARALECMVESTTLQSYMRIRYWEDQDTFLTEETTGISLPFFVKPFLPLIKRKMKKIAQGMAVNKHDREEALRFGMDDIRALSSYLGSKDFILGDRPSRVDAAAFGMLAQIRYVPMRIHPHQDLMDGECRNVGEWCDRVRDRFWKDDWPTPAKNNHA